MKECDICFLKSNYFYNLPCLCKNNICMDCFELLPKPNCPFCRFTLNISKSVSSSSTINNYPLILYDLMIYDDMEIENRSLRRQIRRLRKLQMREQEKMMNRELNETYERSKIKREQRRDINESLEIFMMEE